MSDDVQPSTPSELAERMRVWADRVRFGEIGPESYETLALIMNAAGDEIVRLFAIATDGLLEAEIQRAIDAMPPGSLVGSESWESGVQRMAARIQALEAVVAAGLIAFQFTREYVGEDVLPPIEGWSWFDWTQSAAAVLAAAEHQQESDPK